MVVTFACSVDGKIRKKSSEGEKQEKFRHLCVHGNFENLDSSTDWQSRDNSKLVSS